MTISQGDFDALKAKQFPDQRPERWIPEDYAGLAWVEAGKVVTVPTEEIYCLDVTTGYKPRPGGLEADRLTVYYRDGEGEITARVIPSEARFPAPAYVEEAAVPDTIVGSTKKYLLVSSNP